MFTMKNVCYAQEIFYPKDGDSEQLYKNGKRAYKVDCFQLNTLDEKAYELLKKVIYKQRLEKTCSYNFNIDAKNVK